MWLDGQCDYKYLIHTAGFSYSGGELPPAPLQVCRQLGWSPPMCCCTSNPEGGRSTRGGTARRRRLPRLSMLSAGAPAPCLALAFSSVTPSRLEVQAGLWLGSVQVQLAVRGACCRSTQAHHWCCCSSRDAGLLRRCATVAGAPSMLPGLTAPPPHAADVFAPLVCRSFSSRRSKTMCMWWRCRPQRRVLMKSSSSSPQVRQGWLQQLAVRCGCRG